MTFCSHSAGRIQTYHTLELSGCCGDCLPRREPARCGPDSVRSRRTGSDCTYAVGNVFYLRATICLASSVDLPVGTLVRRGTRRARGSAHVPRPWRARRSSHGSGRNIGRPTPSGALARDARRLYLSRRLLLRSSRCAGTRGARRAARAPRLDPDVAAAVPGRSAEPERRALRASVRERTSRRDRRVTPCTRDQAVRLPLPNDAMWASAATS